MFYKKSHVFQRGIPADGGYVDLELKKIEQVLKNMEQATTGAFGIVRLATDAEARAKSATNRVLTPANLAGIKSVVTAFKTTAGQSIGNSAETQLGFNTAPVDTLSEFTTSATAAYFTAGSDGQYHLDGSILFNSASVTAAMTFYLRVLIDTGGGFGASSFLDRKEPEASNTELIHLTGSMILNLSAGDKVALAAFQNTGSALTLFTDASGHYQRFHIHKIH